jgi:hypothetical protein
VWLDRLLAPEVKGHGNWLLTEGQWIVIALIVCYEKRFLPNPSIRSEGA